jgi:hypothetical protein
MGGAYNPVEAQSVGMTVRKSSPCTPHPPPPSPHWPKMIQSRREAQNTGPLIRRSSQVRGLHITKATYTRKLVICRMQYMRT